MKNIKLFTLLSMTVLASSFVGLPNTKPTDVYPLHEQLDYTYYNEGQTYDIPGKLLADIVKELDIENNPRYFKTGIIYKNGRVYEIPLKEVEDFNLKVSHYNTYCNVFVMDTLNIMANTLKDETYRITNTPINANTLRNRFENSPYWTEVSKDRAIDNARIGKVVVLSHVNQPHGHVAFVKPNSNNGEVYLWNVGSVNRVNLKWTAKSNTKFFVRD